MWAKPDIKRLSPPKPIKFINWFFIVIFLFLCLLCGVWFFFPAHFKFGISFFTALTGGTFVITLLLLGIRLLVYVTAEDKVKVWDKQIEKIEISWQEWAMESLAVLGSVIITPQDLTIDDFINNELSFSAYKKFEFDERNQRFYLDSYEWVFSNLYESLRQIKSKQTLTVFVLSSLDDVNQRTYREKLIKKSLPSIKS